MSHMTVLTGGSTPERDVALAGAAQVVAALRAREHTVSVVDTVSGAITPEDEPRLLEPAVGRAPPELDELAELAARELGPELVTLPALRAADVIFLVLHGRQGEGGEVQSLLESAGLTYTGSDPTGSALAMDKDVAKRLMRDASVPTPAWLMWPSSSDELATLGFPLVIKPSKTGSTLGLTLVEDPDDVAAAVKVARDYDDEVMLEQFAPGREFTVGVLGDVALAAGEIIPSHAIFDYECKYTSGMTQEIFPADIAEGLATQLRALALTVHRALKLRDFSRVDFRLGADGTPFCLEANTLPGVTSQSLLPQSAAATGIAFDELCDRICQLALRRRGTRNKVRA